MYKKDTLYVYVDEPLTGETIRTMENRVNDIMDRYDIENLVVDSKNKSDIYLHEFEKRHNSKYRSKVIIK